MNKLLFLLIFMYLPLLHAEEKLDMILFGGGGEPAGEQTLFDTSLQEIGVSPIFSKLNIKSYFNGGHAKTEKILKDELLVQNQSPKVGQLEKIVDEQIEKMKSGQLKKLLFVIDSHGAEQKEKELTHSVSIGQGQSKDLTHLSGSITVSLDALKKLSDAAKEHNVQLAIMDFSCHSGVSLSLANENTCVVAATGPKQYSYANFANSIYQEMIRGRTMEEVFLSVRKKNPFAAFPMISTDAGRSVEKKLYPILEPYLYYDGPKGVGINKLSNYYRSYLRQMAASKPCERPSPLDEIKKLNAKINLPMERLFAALKSYQSLQDQQISELSRRGGAELAREELITFGAQVGQWSIKQTENITWDDIVNFYPEKDKEYFAEQLAKTKDEKLQTELKAVIDKFEKIKTKRKEILEKYPNLQSSKNIFDIVSDSYKELRAHAHQVGGLSTEAYDQLYMNELKAKPKDPTDPCRRFTF